MAHSFLVPAIERLLVIFFTFKAQTAAFVDTQNVFKTNLKYVKQIPKLRPVYELNFVDYVKNN